MILKRRINPYSARKINEKLSLKYSVLNPETNSDSPSEKSKGVRLSSAKPAQRKIINNPTGTKRLDKNQEDREKLFIKQINVIAIRTKGTS